MKVYRVWKDCMGHCYFLDGAYEHKYVAQCDKPSGGEWVQYMIKAFEGEETSKNRVIVDGNVYSFNKTSVKDYKTKVAYNKLTKEDRTLLGVKASILKLKR